MAKRNTKKALDIGRAFAKETLKRRQGASALRKKALAKNAVLTTRTIETSTKGFGATVSTKTASAGVLVAEGDSWFDYPFFDVLSNLEDIHGYDVEAVSHRGDTVEDMAYGGGQLDAFARCLEKVLRSGVKPKAVLLSGGGNDIAGDEFAILLNHASSSVVGLNKAIMTGLVDERLRDAYVTILNAVTEVCKGLIGGTVPIVIHGYDYSVPDGRGYWGGWGPLPGPWLEPGFRRKGYEAMTKRQPIVIALIDRFNAMLKGVAGKPPFTHVHHLDLRNTLSIGANHKDDWGNELHPSSKGFKKVTQKFDELIKKL